jgi:polar amino acid transport system permease protein
MNILAASEFHIFIERLIAPEHAFWTAMEATVLISITAQILSIALGLVSALMGRSRLWPLRFLSNAYVLVVRGTPVIVQIFFVYFGAALFLGFDPFPQHENLLVVSVSGAAVAGVVALGVNNGAYMSEIIRSGINSVDGGQMESAMSLGMTRGLAMRRIVLPQAARVIIPPLGNEFNGMIKNTSLLAFIGVYEMFFDAQTHYSETFKPVPYFLAVAVWYLLLTTLWTLAQGFIESALDVEHKTATHRHELLSRLTYTFSYRSH